MTTNIWVAGTFVTVTLFVTVVALLVYDLLLKRRLRMRDRLAEEFGSRDDSRGVYAPLFRDVHQNAGEPGTRITLWKRLQAKIVQSGLAVTAQMVVVACFVTAATTGTLTCLATGELWLAIALSVACAPLPLCYVLWVRRRRLQKLCSQLPEAFEFMARALRAGQTLGSSFQIVATRFRAPLADEFSTCYEQQQLGVPHEEALRDLAHRSGVMELQIFAVALIVQRRSGGNLAELLGKMAGMMRKRVWMQGRIRALTGEGRMQAAVLMALPPIAFVVLWFVNRNHAETLLAHPRLLWGAIGSQLLGALMIHRIVNFEY